MAVYVDEMDTEIAQAICDVCGWVSAPIAPERAAAWAREHHLSCRANALAEQAGTR